MARIITDQTYARLVKHLSKDEAVALFQELLLSPKTQEAETAAEIEEENKSEKAGGNE
ncbi:MULTISPECIES: hypothetical protein [unclassified Treponema]|uniref:hypothetical protein n=1 Tax=unclassified Treponema TaxID=2638727 RepID=UPI0020A34B4E|nr:MULTISPECIES: hypothetical protein [unclassified Treponema]UTC66018.1 hypothetical protein E4O06_08275 [Treponema sp. OMZ 789]UTC68748.1 hypothetical protein E4O01_08415 [Treponema sp. OMZ 790]UTC71477.1 hypothetical protein E4O02_08605 [Treponema sp. OMZ 791]